MDWEPVPPGAPAALALTIRGADHDLDFAAGDSVETAFSVSLSVRNAVGGRRRISFSSFGGALSGYFLTNDPAVIARSLASDCATLSCTCGTLSSGSLTLHSSRPTWRLALLFVT